MDPNPLARCYGRGMGAGLDSDADAQSLFRKCFSLLSSMELRICRLNLIPHDIRKNKPITFHKFA